jgi:hypothetical protein
MTKLCYLGRSVRPNLPRTACVPELCADVWLLVSLPGFFFQVYCLPNWRVKVGGSNDTHLIIVIIAISFESLLCIMDYLGHTISHKILTSTLLGRHD